MRILVGLAALVLAVCAAAGLAASHPARPTLTTEVRSTTTSTTTTPPPTTTTIRVVMDPVIGVNWP